MMYVGCMWSNFFVLLAVTAQMAGCYGPVWPSRGMTVKLDSSGPSVMEVKKILTVELESQGFVDIGKGGLDEIKNQRTSFNFDGPDDISVFIGVDRVDEVPIRISQNRKTFTPEANRIFEDLAAALEARWPGSVVREPGPTK